MLSKYQTQFNTLQPFAAIFIRLAFGYHLIQYTYADVFTLSAATNNAGYLSTLGIPFPSIMAWVYILTEFLGGIALIIGFKIRWFAVALIINFLVAVFIAHAHQPYSKSFESIQMLAVSCFFLFNGAGKLSIDSKTDN